MTSIDELSGDDRTKLAVATITGAVLLVTESWVNLSTAIHEGILTPEAAVKEFDDFMLPVAMLSAKLLTDNYEAANAAMDLGEILLSSQFSDTEFISSIFDTEGK